jgi:hypothetical protein
MRQWIFPVILLVLFCGLGATEKKVISVFYKDKKPSQQVLAQVDSLLCDFNELYQIQYFDIEAEENIEIIIEAGLPQTHFPFAIVIEGKFTATIENETISFIHFPLFMKGIGRHEGNWSLADLKKVLDNNELLSTENILPVLDEASETSECDE